MQVPKGLHITWAADAVFAGSDRQPAFRSGFFIGFWEKKNAENIFGDHIGFGMQVAAAATAQPEKGWI